MNTSLPPTEPTGAGSPHTDHNAVQRQKPEIGLIPGFLVQGAATLSTSLASLALMPLVLKASGAGTYGSFVLSSSLVTLLVPLVNLGLGYKGRRLLPNLESVGGRSAVFLTTASMQCLTHLLAVLVMILLFPFLQRILFDGERMLSAYLLPFVVLSLYISNITEDYFRYTHRIKIISLYAVLRSLFYPALVLLLALYGVPISVDSLFLCQSIVGVALGGHLLLKIHRELPLRFRIGSLMQHIEDIRLGFPLASIIVVESLLAVNDRYILAMYLTPASVGIYATACGVGSVMLVFAKVSTGVLSPAMARAVDQLRKDEAEAMLEKTLKIYLIISLPFAGGAAVLGSNILKLLANAEVAAQANLVVPLVALSTTIYGYRYIVFSALFVGANTGLWMRANIAAGFASILMNAGLLLLWPRLEIAAITAIISHAFSLSIICQSRGLNWRLRWDWGYVGRVILSVVGMMLLIAIALNSLQPVLPNTGLLVIIIPLGIMVYIGLLLACGALTINELKLLRSAVRR